MRGADGSPLKGDRPRTVELKGKQNPAPQPCQSRGPCAGEKGHLPMEEFWGGRPRTLHVATGGPPSQTRLETFAPNAEKAGWHTTGE